MNKRLAILLIILLFISVSGVSFGKSKDKANTHDMQGIKLYKKGKYHEAIKLFEKALKIKRGINNKNNIAASLSNIGSAYGKLGQYEQALSYHEESLKIKRELNTPQGIATSLKNISAFYKNFGQYEQALSYLEEELMIRRKLNIPKDITVSLNNIATVYYYIGQYEQALSYLEESLKIKRELNTPQGIATGLNNIGAVYSNLVQHEKAMTYYEESLKIRRQLKIPQQVAQSLNNIGSVYWDLGQYKKALTYHEEALKIFRELNMPQDIAIILSNIGSAYGKLGQYEQALSYHEESLKIKRELNTPQGIATSLNFIGVIYHHIGQYEKALSYYEETLNIRRQLKIPQDTAASLSNIGAIYKNLGLYEKALIYNEEALKTFKELNIPHNIANILNNIASVYRALGQHENTLSYYEESLKIRRQLKIPQQVAQSLNNIGSVYSDLGQYKKALTYDEEALKTFRELNMPLDIARSLYNIGDIYLTQKRYQKAARRFNEAVKEEEKVGRSWIVNASFVKLHLATGEFDKALSLFNEKAPRWNSSNPGRTNYYTMHGLALSGNGRLQEASHELYKAVALIEEMRQSVKKREGFLGAKSRINAYRGLIASLSERAMQSERIDKKFANYGKDLASNAFYFSESTKARVLLEAMAQSARQYDETELPAELRKKEQSLLNQLSAVEKNWEDTYKKGEEVFKQLQERKKKLQEELDTLISEIRKKYPRYAALKYPRPILAEDLPLKDNEVLLEYAIDDKATYLFKVKKGGVKQIIKIAEGKEELEKLVSEFIYPLQSIYAKEEFSPSKGFALYNLLLKEALKDVPKDKDIIIVPDGILGLLPFEALIIKEGKSYKDSEYVGDERKLTYAQSASVLALNRLLKPSTAPKTLFALGNPVYDEKDPRYIAYKNNKEKPVQLAQNLQEYAYRGLATRAEWGKTTRDERGMGELIYIPLPETETEVRSIASLFNVQPERPDILLNIEANETNLRRTPLKEYRYLHFATHADLPGKVQGINEPFILLGQVENAEGDDGFLTLTEVLGLKLNADMTVLSACMTGRGKMMEGEGVVNFARAFQHAGVRSVVVSLWEVASNEAVEYMEIFYGYLKEGKGRAEALRLARNEMKLKYPNPFYWAVFILHGEG